MRNTRTITADWRLLFHEATGGLAVGLLPHDDSDALIVPMDVPLLRELGRSMLAHAIERYPCPDPAEVEPQWT